MRAILVTHRLSARSDQSTHACKFTFWSYPGINTIAGRFSERMLNLVQRYLAIRASPRGRLAFAGT
eukprot:SAG11_NODE_1329_length_5192_cov_3.608286_1_plen_66_part_00